MKSINFTNLDQYFRPNKDALWGCLSRQNNLLVVANFSLFFLSGLVAKGYYYTFISLFFLGLSGVGMVLPVPFHNRFAYYLACLLAHLIGLYFLVISVVFWVHSMRH